MEENGNGEIYKPVVTISINSEGRKKIDVAPVAKEVIMDLLLRAVGIVAMKPNNVVKVNPAGVRSFINRHRNKNKGAFGG